MAQAFPKLSCLRGFRRPLPYLLLALGPVSVSSLYLLDIMAASGSKRELTVPKALVDQLNAMRPLCQFYGRGKKGCKNGASCPQRHSNDNLHTSSDFQLCFHPPPQTPHVWSASGICAQILIGITIQNQAQRLEADQEWGGLGGGCLPQMKGFTILILGNLFNQIGHQ